MQRGEPHPSSRTRLWAGLLMVFILSFATLGYFGRQIYRKAPPVPASVATTDGRVLFSGEDIKDGQEVWQSMGGQQVGSIWGHGAYQAPDWSADWLHREAAHVLDAWAKGEGAASYAALPAERQAALRARLQQELRTNTYDPATGVLTVSAVRAEAMAATGAHYAGLFGDDPTFERLRSAYAVKSRAVTTPERQAKLNAFFFWASWSCVTQRPGEAVSYTNNWPSDPLVGNAPSSSVLLWSMISIVALLAGIGALAWHHAAAKHEEAAPEAPARDPFGGLALTPSMKATLKYFWVVAALIVAQIGLGAVTAHFGVEGNAFYGFKLSEVLPYAVTRTWHTQLGIFWIATSWLATGLFVAPMLGGAEPRFQRLGVNVLFGALLVIVVGSLAGQWFAVMQRLNPAVNFWFGHQGFEYVDLGRFWQIFLFAGLFIWLGLMLRALWPALRRREDSRSLLFLFVMSAVAIASFYGAGLMWGRRTHLAMSEYWRWWVVHLWVEGFFEVFATAVLALVFTKMKLLRARTATDAVIFSTSIFLAGGILGTFHHLYFTGTPTSVMALGATFSALEIVPLVLIGREAVEQLRMPRLAPWLEAYRWPVMFFVAVAFWNLLGAGVFGFLINPPIALYYMQGLNTTPVHGHTALFGVYGMLGIGLMLLCLRWMDARAWNPKLLRFAFWTINGGLLAMVVLSLLPIGLLQTAASVQHGMWYARSAEFLNTPAMQTLKWMRAFGDTLFALGILALVAFIAGLKGGWSLAKAEDGEEADEAPVPALLRQ